MRLRLFQISSCLAKSNVDGVLVDELGIVLAALGGGVPPGGVPPVPGGVPLVPKGGVLPVPSGADVNDGSAAGASVSPGAVPVTAANPVVVAEETDFPVFGDVVNLLSLDVVSVSSSLFLCFNSDNLLREDPTLLGFKTDFEDRARVDIDLSGVTSESLSSSLLA